MRFSLHYSRRYRVSCRTLKRTLERRHSTWAPMQYTRLGSTGLQISRICLGTMSFGNSEEWMVELEKAKPIVKRAVDLGMNFFDTANLYSNGRSEEIVGELLKGHRDDVVIMQGSRNRLDPVEPAGKRILDGKIQTRKGT